MNAIKNIFSHGEAEVEKEEQKHGHSSHNTTTSTHNTVPGTHSNTTSTSGYQQTGTNVTGSTAQTGYNTKSAEYAQTAQPGYQSNTTTTTTHHTAPTTTYTDTITETAPVITHEQIQRNILEETQVIQDREHHVDHYQQRVQPIADKVINPTIERENVLAVEHREVNHGMTEGAARVLEQQKAAFRDERTVLPTMKQNITKETIGSDVTHHHVHEVIQPVIERQVVEQEIIHTVIPIHETIVEKPVIHESTVEPVISLAEFQARGLHAGQTTSTNVLAGEPQVLTHGSTTQSSTTQRY